MALLTEGNAEFITAVATSILAFVAVLALVEAWWQISVSQRLGREATAIHILHEYEKLCFEYPKFANTKLLGTDAINFEDRHINGDKILFEKYQWFVALMLEACDEMIHAFGKEKDWKRYLIHHLEYHKPYLKSRCFEPLRPEVSEYLRNLIDQLF